MFSEDSDPHIVRSMEVPRSLTQKVIKVSKLKDWLKLPAFYIFGLCYTGVRLYSNLFGTLLPFYPVHVLKLGRSANFDPDKDVAASRIPSWRRLSLF